MNETLSGIVAKAFADPAESVTLPVEKQSDGEREWFAWRIEPADREGFGKFVERLGGMAPHRAPALMLDADFRIYAARLENPETLVVASGPLGRDAFAAILKYAAETAESAASPFDAPATAAALDDLGAAQFSLGLLNPEELYLLFMQQFAAHEGEKLPPALFDGEQSADADALLGFGAEDGSIAASLALPAASVNAAIRMHERLAAME